MSTRSNAAVNVSPLAPSWPREPVSPPCGNVHGHALRRDELEGVATSRAAISNDRTDAADGHDVLTRYAPGRALCAPDGFALGLPKGRIGKGLVDQHIQ